MLVWQKVSASELLLHLLEDLVFRANRLTATHCVSLWSSVCLLIGIHTTRSWWGINNKKILNVQLDLSKLLTCIQVTNTQQFSLELQGL